MSQDGQSAGHDGKCKSLLDSTNGSADCQTMKLLSLSLLLSQGAVPPKQQGFARDL